MVQKSKQVTKIIRRRKKADEELDDAIIAEEYQALKRYADKKFKMAYDYKELPEGEFSIRECDKMAEERGIYKFEEFMPKPTKKFHNADYDTREARMETGNRVGFGKGYKISHRAVAPKQIPAIIKNLETGDILSKEQFAVVKTTIQSLYKKDVALQLISEIKAGKKIDEVVMSRITRALAFSNEVPVRVDPKRKNKHSKKEVIAEKSSETEA